MTIRRYNDSDYQEVHSLATKYELNIPESGDMMVTVDDNGNLKGFMVVRPVMMIEPFIGENSLANKKLFDKFEWLMNVSKVKVVRCNVEKKNKKLMEKLGYYPVFEDHIQMEKCYVGNESEGS